MSSSTGSTGSTAPRSAPRTAEREPQTLGRELGSSALLLGLSFAVTAVVVTTAQAAAAFLG